MGFLSGLSVFVWGWLIFAVIMMLIEAMTVSLVSIWFAAGGIAAAVTAFFTDRILVQLLIFVLVSLILVIFTRPLAARRLNDKVEKTNSEALIGKKAIVIKDITPIEYGEVKIEGKVWTAAVECGTRSFAEGDIVNIKAIEGVKLIVE